MPVGAKGDGWLAFGVALVARLAVAAWAAGRFPPAGDGTFFDTLARRIAHGDGYTWLWPDGAVTNVAHYPVGYPALVALGYALFGAHAVVAMGVNAVFGAAMALAVHRLASAWTSRVAALAAALAVALHPALVPYTAAVMTEGVAAALVVIAFALARLRGRSWVGWALAGVALGVATLVRPQCLALAPFLGAMAPVGPTGWAARARAAAVVTVVTLACCAPWTARNCVAMHQCALVSVNGGWNLAIGAQTTSGAWQPIDVPAACREVWDEAAKDACFGGAARAAILRDPIAWLARAPAKLAVTFDYFGAAPWYLHLANGQVFGERAKWWLGAVETLACRVTLLFALAVVGREAGPARRTRLALCLVGAVFACATYGVVAYLALGCAILALGPRFLARAPIVLPATALVLAATAATHAVFFGAGRYGLVVVPFVTVIAFGLGEKRDERDKRGEPIPPDASASAASSASIASVSLLAAVWSCASVAAEASRASALYW
jgi:4-amino-4-deoxy-L-arabinose transferase-like glycosyltransferase